MGSAMARVLFDLERPTVGLLNIGVEEVKGGEEIRKAAEMLRFLGFRPVREVRKSSTPT